MLRVNEQLRKTALRVEQLKNQNNLKKRRKREAERKIEIRRYIIIGEIICKYFPEMKDYRPQQNSSDNAKEFADFESLLRLLANNQEMLTRLIEDANNLVKAK